MTANYISWREAKALAHSMHKRIGRPSALYGVPRGGWPVAMLLAANGHSLAETPEAAEVIVDDIVDSGRTKAKWKKLWPDKPFHALVDRKRDKLRGWQVFPWEHQDPDVDAEDSVVRLLQFLGEDPTREGLVETPARVVKAWQEMTAGYRMDPAKILAKDFDGHGVDQLILCPNISFYSNCEHHLLPFFGVAHVGYLPKKRVVGLSKMARVVECFARRLQIQEKLTEQVAQAMEDALKPLGVAVVVQAKHLCMSCRGVKQHSASMMTSSMRGVFASQAPARAEFFKLLDLAKEGV